MKTKSTKEEYLVKARLISSEQNERLMLEYASRVADEVDVIRGHDREIDGHLDEICRLERARWEAGAKLSRVLRQKLER